MKCERNFASNSKLHCGLSLGFDIYPNPEKQHCGIIFGTYNNSDRVLFFMRVKWHRDNTLHREILYMLLDIPLDKKLHNTTMALSNMLKKVNLQCKDCFVFNITFISGIIYLILSMDIFQIH